ncbi:MAG: DEAD/DEAH box helicase family protein, partial [Candidatus Pacearchaeota archaeon]
MEAIKKFLINITPRDYQIKIVESCINKNSLVVMPTGMGKTLIALMLAIEIINKFPMKKILFLAPTRPLAEQHLNYFKKHLPELFAEMTIFTGKIKAEIRKKIWEKTDIIFSTPQCIRNDLKNNFYNLSEVSLLIEDEVHRCVKNYSYTFVAKKYLDESKKGLILGLTASPGADKNIIKTICDNLSIKNIEIKTRESVDIKPHLQKLKFKEIKIEFPKRFIEIREELKKIYDKKINELRNRNLIYGPANKIVLLECQRKIMRSIATGNKNFNLFHGASACATAIKIQHAIELLETQTLNALNIYIENLLNQSKENKSRAVKSLVSSPEFTNAKAKLDLLLREKQEHPKIFELKSIIEEKIKKSKKIRIIVFCQYRDSISTICKELNSIKNIKAKVFVGQAKKSNSGLSQKEQREIINSFSRGEFNTLCATSIGEEGLDIPEVNSVIFYEPIPSAIRKIQRTGRTARLM